MSEPVVTIVILNYQRAETLRLAVGRALAQDDPRVEVVVVDNASTDGSDRMVEREFPQVRLVRLPRNVGCAARNAGVAAARGEIVITLDNDVLLLDENATRTVSDVFARRPYLACMDFKILDTRGEVSRRDWCHPRDWRRSSDKEFLTDYVLEGACAFRREPFLRVGGYWEPFFLGHEGWDLGLRLLEAGYELLYSPRVRVSHLTSAEARPSSRIYYTFTRNAFWVAARNYSGLPAARVVAKDLALMAFSSARAGQWASYFRGVRDGVLGWRRARAGGHPLSRFTRDRLRTIRGAQPTVVEKAVRHWKERPI